VAQSLESIPNNVDLSSDRRLQRALEQWQPNFLSWWKEVGPEGFQAHNIYLRTAISVEANGWAHFDYVKMPDYRWGIFLEPHDGERTIGFGDVMGEKVWTDVPGEHRNALRRIIVTQADTEPASVEQQRLLGKTCPSSRSTSKRAATYGQWFICCIGSSAATVARRPMSSCSAGRDLPTSRAS
jgi:benzoyl-CoA 2,3-dioxygenase component B